MNTFRSSSTEVKQQSKYKNNLYGNSISLMYKVHFQKNYKRRNTLSPNPQANRVLAVFRPRNLARDMEKGPKRH